VGTFNPGAELSFRLTIDIPAMSFIPAARTRPSQEGEVKDCYICQGIPPTRRWRNRQDRRRRRAGSSI